MADGTTLEYVLAKRLGDEMTLGDTGVRVRFVAALRSGLLQSELITGERHFQRAFPDEHGYRFFLIEAPPGREADICARLESTLSDFGFDVTEAATRLNAYHRVEHTYIATFQTLGALGPLLGTVGLAAILLRNGFERRRALAVLHAMGYQQRQLVRILPIENALVLGVGLIGGCPPSFPSHLPSLSAERDCPCYLAARSLSLSP